MPIRTIGQEVFRDEVIESPKPVLVDFYADWCGPCRVVGPIVERLADEYGERLEVRKVDVDESPTLARQYGVRSIPTLVLFKDGRPAETVVGAVPRSKLAEVVDRYAT